MTAAADAGHSPPAEPTTGTPRRSLDARWTRLQQIVALGETAVFAGIMLFVRGQVIVPLAIAAALFATGAAVSLRAGRAGAIAVGVIAVLWLGSNIAFAPQVVPDLLAIEVTEIFLPTFAMNVLAVAGVVGLVGSLRRARGGIAATTQNAALALLAGGAVVSVMAGVL